MWRDRERRQGHADVYADGNLYLQGEDNVVGLAEATPGRLQGEGAVPHRRSGLSELGAPGRQRRAALHPRPGHARGIQHQGAMIHDDQRRARRARRVLLITKPTKHERHERGGRRRGLRRSTCATLPCVVSGFSRTVDTSSVRLQPDSTAHRHIICTAARISAIGYILTPRTGSPPRAPRGALEPDSAQDVARHVECRLVIAQHVFESITLPQGRVELLLEVVARRTCFARLMN